MLDWMTTVRSYEESDRSALLRLISALQNHIASLDPLRRQKSSKDFDVGAYVANMLERVQRERGCILVAEENDTPVGCIVGVIPSPTSETLLESYPVSEGVILELVVEKGNRGSGIGSELMRAMETYFREEGCEQIRVSCFAPNTQAHRFYEASGYEDRNIEMVKRLSQLQ